MMIHQIGKKKCIKQYQYHQSNQVIKYQGFFGFLYFFQLDSSFVLSFYI